MRRCNRFYLIFFHILWVALQIYRFVFQPYTDFNIIIQEKKIIVFRIIELSLLEQYYRIKARVKNLTTDNIKINCDFLDLSCESM